MLDAQRASRADMTLITSLACQRAAKRSHNVARHRVANAFRTRLVHLQREWFASLHVTDVAVDIVVAIVVVVVDVNVVVVVKIKVSLTVVVDLTFFCLQTLLCSTPSTPDPHLRIHLSLQAQGLI